jgi:hypothetical protein
LGQPALSLNHPPPELGQPAAEQERYARAPEPRVPELAQRARTIHERSNPLRGCRLVAYHHGFKKPKK